MKLLLLLVVVYLSQAVRVCESTGDPHLRTSHGKYFNDYVRGWRLMYELHGIRVRTFQSETRIWKEALTIKEAELNYKGDKLYFRLDLRPKVCRVEHKGASKGLKITAEGNGYKVEGPDSFRFQINAGCLEDSGYLNIYLQDDSRALGKGQCFSTKSNDLPSNPTQAKCPFGRQKARRLCHRVRCHRGVFASCVEDTCLTGDRNIAHHLERISKIRNGKPCRNTFFKHYGVHLKKCRKECTRLDKECITSAECGNKLTGVVYTKICRDRKRKCHHACRDHWRRVVKCLRSCRVAKRKCEVLRKCAAGVVTLGLICKKRHEKCEVKCVSSYVRK
jgi:hypothetical protein